MWPSLTAKWGDLPAWLVALLPVFTLVLGWMLSEFSSALRGRGETKAKIGRALTPLMGLYFEINTRMRVLEKYKDLSPSTEEFERFRQRAVKRYSFHEEGLGPTLDEVLRDVAEVDPITAVNLKRSLEMIMFEKKIALNWSLNNFHLYIRALSSIEAATQLNAEAIKKDCMRLALRASLVTFCKSLETVSQMEKQRCQDGSV